MLPGAGFLSRTALVSTLASGTSYQLLASITDVGYQRWLTALATSTSYRGPYYWDLGYRGYKEYLLAGAHITGT